MKIEKFNKFFESVDYLSIDDIKDIFSELLDNGFEFKTYDRVPGFYFKVFKRYSNKFEYHLSDSIWGCTDLKSINKEITNVFDKLEEIKLRLDDAGYLIAFEPELSFAEESNIDIVCHCQRKSLITYDE